jgi:7,8-dihydro-6-hydroxymethylpterin-pyrophosphokinase
VLFTPAGRDLIGARRFGPRPLDLDIVFYGNQDVQHEVLSVPHIRCASRCCIPCAYVHAYKMAVRMCSLRPRTLVCKILQSTVYRLAIHSVSAHCTSRLPTFTIRISRNPNTATRACLHKLCTPTCSWQDRAFVKAPMADLLLPEDIQRGYIREPAPQASVLEKLLTAVQQWEAEGGEAQVTVHCCCCCCCCSEGVTLGLHVPCGSYPVVAVYEVCMRGTVSKHTVACTLETENCLVVFFCCRLASLGCAACCQSTGRSGSWGTAHTSAAYSTSHRTASVTVAAT